MPETDFDDLEIQDDEENENVAKIGKNDLKRLRDAAKSGRAAVKELDGLRRQTAITDAGLKDLNTDQREALSLLVTEATPENLRAKAEALGWVEKRVDPEQQQIDQEIADQTSASAAATGAGAPVKNTISNEDYTSWPIDKRMRLQDNHPEVVEALMREDREVRLPAGFQ